MRSINTYDTKTDNMAKRWNVNTSTETFSYDKADRLTTGVSYAANGNIANKTNIGQYPYNSLNKPHAVTSVTNTGKLISAEAQSVTYTPFNKVASVAQGSNSLAITYGPDRQRVRTVFRNSGSQQTRIYADNYERLTINGSTQHMHYIYSPDGLAGVYVQNGSSGKFYVAQTDNLGSILRLYDSNGTISFRANYDPWGRRTAATNTLNFRRGFTGHEHWDEFGLIDMNGRFYDPLIGRFLSPDPYVQAPTNSQNFNRYSYCLNNPLKYTDPSGESFLMAAAIGGIINVAIQGFTKGLNGSGDFFKYFTIGALAGAGGAWAGQAVGAAIGSVGFGSGSISGAVGGFSGGFITGAGNSWTNGASFKGGIQTGLVTGGISATTSSLVSGISSGICSSHHGDSFWSSNSFSSTQSSVCGSKSSAIVCSDKSVMLEPVNVIAYNYHSYAQAAMEIFNQVFSSCYSLTSGNNLLAKMWFHYQFGRQEPIFLDASTLDFSNIVQDNIKNNGINTYKYGGINNTSLTLGKISVRGVGDNLYQIAPDTYNFNIEIGDSWLNLFTKRNIATICSGVLHNTRYSMFFGGEFDIYPVGLVKIAP